MAGRATFASTVDDMFQRTALPLSALLLLPLSTLPACSSESGSTAQADKSGVPAKSAQNPPKAAADKAAADADAVAEKIADNSPAPPDTAEDDKPVPSVTWSCLCYYHKVDGGREAMTACRPTTQECKKLESRTAKGSRTIIAGSLTRACREIGAAAHPADVLGKRDLWRASSKPGSYVLAGLCPLKMLPDNPMTADSFQTAIGPLDLGIPDEAVIAALGPPESKGEASVEPATGDTLQTWSYESQGLTLTMALDNDNAVLSDVLVKAPSTLKTREGIGIGSSFKEARSLYSRALAPEEEQFNHNVLVVGSIYGGLFVTKKKGLVSELFLGAGAE